MSLHVKRLGCLMDLPMDFLHQQTEALAGLTG